MSLPNLLIIGVPKAATGSLFAYLAQHPRVCASTRKEIRYFTPDAADGRSRPLEWYERFFANRTDEPVALEATPSYCYLGPRVIDAIRATLPSPKLVVILRDPADRLWSAFTFQRSLGHLPAGLDDFDAFVQACDERRRAEPDIRAQGTFKGLAIGRYGDYLPAWDDAFGTDLRVIAFEDLVRDPRGVLRATCGWLGIDAAPVDGFDLDPRNPTVHPRSTAAARGAAAARTWSKQALRRAPGLRRRLRDAYLRANAGTPPARPSEDSMARLRELYADSNDALAAMLRRRGIETMPTWLEAQPPDASPG